MPDKQKQALIHLGVNRDIFITSLALLVKMPELNELESFFRVQI